MKKNSGFTLIELIAVISLISIMLFFALPRFQVDMLTDNPKKVSRWILTKVRALKVAAARDQRLYGLNISIDNNRFWITNETMSEEELQNAEQNGYALPADINIVDIEFSEKGKVSIGHAEISFYKNNYSDKALIHIEDDNNRQFSFLIEPFLPNVKIYERYIGFED
ncbi:Tfp pilus assembly protein FimT/FimU [Thermodesulfobacteriota bacterium]